MKFLCITTCTCTGINLLCKSFVENFAIHPIWKKTQNTQFSKGSEIVFALQRMGKYITIIWNSAKDHLLFHSYMPGLGSSALLVLVDTKIRILVLVFVLDNKVLG